MTVSLTTSTQAWLAQLGARERSALTARRHIEAETLTGDDSLDAICATVSDDVFFAVPGDLVLTDPAEIRGYYAGRAGSYVVRSSQQLTSIATDWYVLNDTSATLLGTGDVNGIDATGREWVVRSVVLFPTAGDGIRGEICATRAPFDDVLRGVPTKPGDAVANAALLDELSLAVRGGRDVGHLLAPNHHYAVRVGGDVHQGSGAWQPTFDGDVTLLVRHATEWYVFAEYLDEAANRVALIHAVEDGRIIGTFGYGCCDDTESTSPTR